MAHWEHILLERRVLWWATSLVLLGTILWLVSLATPYWLIHLTPPHSGPGLVWGYSGIWTKCDLMDLGSQGSQGSQGDLRWQCWSTVNIQSTLIRWENTEHGEAVRVLGFL